MKKKIAIIIGAMKCGTTSLFYYLSEHPQICPASDKEPFFFCDDKRYQKGFNWYNSLWQWEAEHHIALEASTGYTMYPRYLNIVDRMAQMPEVDFQFIYIMRNPIERIQSQIRHELARNFGNNLNVTKEQVYFSKYSMQIDIFANKFGQKNIHLLLLQDLMSDPSRELKRICKFLNINQNHEFVNAKKIKNSHDNPSQKLHPLVKKIYRNPLINSVTRHIPPAIKEKLYTPLSSKKILEITLTSQQKEDIISYLTPDLQRLRDTYGIDAAKYWQIEI